MHATSSDAAIRQHENGMTLRNRAAFTLLYTLRRPLAARLRVAVTAPKVLIPGTRFLDVSDSLLVSGSLQPADTADHSYRQRCSQSLRDRSNRCTPWIHHRFPLDDLQCRYFKVDIFPILCELAHVVVWDPCNLYDLARVSWVASVLRMQILHNLSQRQARN